MTVDFGAVVPYLPDLLAGIRVTLIIAFSSFVLGSALGLVLAGLRISRSRIARIASTAYTDFFNSTPILVQLFWLYYLLPQAFGIRLTDLTVLIAAITLNVSAVLGENFRAGLLSVDAGQRDASSVLGLSRITTIGEIVMPQALRIALPLMGNTSIGLLKDTSVATFIGTNDLMNSARDVAINTYRPIEIFTLVAVIYFALTYPLSLLTSYLERRGAWTRTVAL